jgi:hypothetical protein
MPAGWDWTHNRLSPGKEKARRIHGKLGNCCRSHGCPYHDKQATFTGGFANFFRGLESIDFVPGTAEVP